MTSPYEFTPVVEQSFDKRDPSEFIPWMRCTETPHRVGKLLIVRPLKMIDDFRPLPEGADPSKWRGQLCVADVACLDPIEPAFTDLGEQLPGFAAGTQFRDQTIFLGHLNKGFKNYIGKTCLGTVFTMPTQYAKPAVHWRDLSGDQNAVVRAQGFLRHFPDFLIPVAARFTEVAPQQQQQQPVQQYQPQAQQQYHTSDPWAGSAPQQAPQEVWANAPVSPGPTSAAQRPMTTLDQLKQANAINHQGDPQSTDAPF